MLHHILTELTIESFKKIVVYICEKVVNKRKSYASPHDNKICNHK